MTHIKDQFTKRRRPVKYFWAEETEDKLVDLYESHPLLYDSMSPGFSNRTQKENTIKKFSEELGVPVDEVERHLRSLRTQYGRERKVLKVGDGNQPKALSFRSKQLLRRLEFLDPYVKMRNKTPGPRQPSVEGGSSDQFESSERYEAEKYDEFELEETDQITQEAWLDGYTNGQNTVLKTENCYEAPEEPPLFSEQPPQPTLPQPQPQPQPPQSNTAMLQQSMNVIQCMSQAISDSNSQDIDEEGLWGKMIVKKLKRVRKQEVKEDLMMHIDQLITRAIRGQWPSPVHNNAGPLHNSIP